MKIGCLIYATGSLHEKLFYCASRSFKKWHPTIPLMGVKSEHINLDVEIVESSQEMSMPVGIRKYAIGHRMMKELNLDKLIILGSDTITCSKLDEFLNDTKHDVLTTCDYPYTLVTPVYNGGYFNAPHVNADVVCFNNVNVLGLTVERAPLHGNYFEQGALNEVCYTPTKPQIFSKVVDMGGETNTYEDSDVVYNARVKGNLIAATGTKPFFQYTSKFEVRDSKLYVPENSQAVLSKEKQIKVFHYCDGLGNLNINAQISLMNDWLTKGFNEDTKKFFKEHCDCGDFFDGEFTL
tara:strand:- start:1150 stop:2031 length:882 start_codon:yes stop_codon:yes gene_type:complete